MDEFWRAAESTWSWLDWDAVGSIATAVSVVALIWFSTQQRSMTARESERLRLADMERQARHVYISLTPVDGEVLPVVSVRNDSTAPVFKVQCELVPKIRLEKRFSDDYVQQMHDVHPAHFDDLFWLRAEPIGQLPPGEHGVVYDGLRAEANTVLVEKVADEDNDEEQEPEVVWEPVFTAFPDDFIATVTFTDSNDLQWTREATGKLTQVVSPERSLSDRVLMRVLKWRWRKDGTDAVLGSALDSALMDLDPYGGADLDRPFWDAYSGSSGEESNFALIWDAFRWRPCRARNTEEDCGHWRCRQHTRPKKFPLDFGPAPTAE
jgi:hypothetical protein